MGVVKEISSLSEFNDETNKKLTIVDFYADWCGPCRACSPLFAALADKYSHINFCKVNSDSEWSSGLGVRSLPTFRFYSNSKLLSDVVGANMSAVEAKIEEYKALSAAGASFDGKGFTLGSSSGSSSQASGISDSKISADAAREARLKAFSSSSSSSSTGSSSSSSSTSSSSSAAKSDANKATQDEDDDEALAKAVAASMVPAESKVQLASLSVPPPTANPTDNQADILAAEAEFDKAANDVWEEEMVPVQVDEHLLKQLLDMGIPDVRGRKGLVHGTTLEGALDWIATNEDDPEIDQPYMVKKSDTMPKPPLTADERKRRELAVRELIAKKKAERLKKEKADELIAEKERRERGQTLAETQTERDRLARKREAERQAKEKKDAVKEKERLLAEIARDKAIRKANKGALPSVLGVDGYNPSAVQYDAAAAAAVDVPAPDSGKVAGVSASTAAPVFKPATAAAPSKVSNSITSATAADADSVIDASIQTIMKYRTGGDGGNALKLLITFVKNIVDNPDDVKYRSINTESNAFKSKLGGIVGGVAVLKALRFEKYDDGKLKLDGEVGELMKSTLQKLIKAEETYMKMNPV